MSDLFERRSVSTNMDWIGILIDHVDASQISPSILEEIETIGTLKGWNS